MIITRGLRAIKLTHQVAKNLLVPNLKNNVQTQISRGHGGEFYYRKAPRLTPSELVYVESLMSIFWWWVTWHMITDYHELLPPHLPDPSKFTDEELGIPPDDAD